MTSTKKAAAGQRSARKTVVAGKVTGRKVARAEATAIEEARAYRRRLEAWAGSLGPRNAVERYLLERAVSLSWQLDRAEQARLAPTARARDEPEGTETGEPIPPPVLDGDRPSQRLLRQQLSCGRALLRTLGAFARLRDLQVVEPAEKEDRPAAPVVVEPAAATVEVKREKVTPIGLAPARRRRVGEPGHRLGDWPSDRRNTGPAADPSESRRRVGGYAVPMDPSFPVSCADKIPVRLRRARAAASLR